MQPLGLTRTEVDRYVALLQSPHDFQLDIDVLNMEERVVGSMKVRQGHQDGPGFTDGQVNLQRTATIKRTSTFNLFDPDHSLHLDRESPFAGAAFANRMMRARVGVDLPGHGMVWATPFVGPMVRVRREGDVLVIECQDKTQRAVEGVPPMTRKKGHNAVDAIRDFMRERTGERRFRFPTGNKRRLTRAYTVGWTPEASPWVVCQKIAKSIGMQLIYSCDGALLLRRKPTSVALDLTSLTGPVASDYDITQVRNYVRVTGDKKKKKGAEAPKHQKHTEFTVDAPAPRQHPMSPQKLGRHGVNFYLPLLIDDPEIKKELDAQHRANDELAAALPMGVTASVPAAPFFHLDYSDIARAATDFGTLNLPFVEGSLPFGLAGDASYGAQKRVSQPRRRS